MRKRLLSELERGSRLMKDPQNRLLRKRLVGSVASAAYSLAQQREDRRGLLVCLTVRGRSKSHPQVQVLGLRCSRPLAQGGYSNGDANETLLPPKAYTEVDKYRSPVKLGGFSAFAVSLAPRRHAGFGRLESS